LFLKKGLSVKNGIAAGFCAIYKPEKRDAEVTVQPMPLAQATQAPCTRHVQPILKT
jgi:hypothetical protein